MRALTRGRDPLRIGEDSFEAAAKEYRRAVSRADRVRTSRLVGLWRAHKAGLPESDVVPTEEEVDAEAAKIAKAFERLSESM
jgi:hypothetical protein